MPIRSYVTAMLMTVAGLATAAAQNPAKTVQIEKERIRVEARFEGGRPVELYRGRLSGAWVDVAENSNGGDGGSATLIGKEFVAVGKVKEGEAHGPELWEELEVACQRVERRLSLEADGPWVHVSCRLHGRSRNEGRMRPSGGNSAN